MAGTIAAILIVIWFYKSALKSGKEPLRSAALGFAVYFIPALVWTLVITPGMRDAVEHSPNTPLALVVQYTYVIVGMACAAWVKAKHFENHDKDS
jgi:hypothetical protein